MLTGFYDDLLADMAIGFTKDIREHRHFVIVIPTKGNAPIWTRQVSYDPCLKTRLIPQVPVFLARQNLLKRFIFHQ